MDTNDSDAADLTRVTRERDTARMERDALAVKLGVAWADLQVMRVVDAEHLQRAVRAESEANRLFAERTGKVWMWNGDGSDDPDSLSCPVLMTAEQARELLAERNEARAGIGKMQEVVRNAGIDAVREYLPDFDESRIDGAGTDSDEYDFTAAEVAQAVCAVGEKLDEARAEADRLRRALAAERATCDAATDHVAICPDCGEVETCNEDRCCAACGRDLLVFADRHSAELYQGGQHGSR